MIFIYLILWKPHFISLVTGRESLVQALFGDARLDFNHLAQILGEVHLTPLLICFFITPVHVLLRSHRWVLMVRKISNLKLIDSFSLQMVGYLANSILPLRMGEVVRGVMLARRQNIPTSSGLGTVLIERILDMFSMLVLAAIVGFIFPFPRELAEAAVIFGAMALAGIVLTVYLAVVPDPFGGRIGKLVGGGRIASIVKEKGNEFAAVFSMFRQTEHHWIILLETFVLWLMYALQGYLVLVAFDFPNLYPSIGQQPILAAFVVLVINAIGVSLPSAPAGVGTFHAVLIFGLSLFAIPTDQATGFALVIHAVSALFYILLGLPLMWREGIHLSELKKIEEAQLDSKSGRKTK